ncbi:HNF C domain containing protein [Euroglyphus maynei]|uniref:HNF C domain containing protein n=1 Tax=Euroglyphus maynei TaxID=6958 RepID=A0A1Y3BN52_EURMA|nr:HNF C domain containing protein [Euroglyphus maynei]
MFFTGQLRDTHCFGREHNPFSIQSEANKGDMKLYEMQCNAYSPLSPMTPNVHATSMAANDSAAYYHHAAAHQSLYHSS